MSRASHGELQKDDNGYPVMGGVSSLDITLVQNAEIDPITGRLLVDISGSSAGAGLIPLTAAGTVNGVNKAFIFTQLPTYIVSDGVWYTILDSNGNTQWTWNSGTLTATMVIPPTTSIFGLVNATSVGTIYTDTVSGTINSSNKTFTVSNTISVAMVLFLAGVPYQPGVDFNTVGTTITMVTAPDSSLSGQPFWLIHT